jgi:carbon storage regulator CsrA
MLVLTRRAGESVFLTDSNTGQSLGEIKILNVTPGHGVRIGFDCPAHISIVRDDVNEQVKEV